MRRANHLTSQFQSCNMRQHSCNMEFQSCNMKAGGPEIHPPVLEILEPRLLLTVLYWDPDGNPANNNVDGTCLGGAGNWTTDTQSLSWWDPSNPSVNVAWNNSNADEAVFIGTSCGDTAGPVSLAAGGITAGSITFKTDGYTIQNNTLTLSGGDVTLDGVHNVYATISSVIAGSAGLSVNGWGGLTLNGSNTYTGGTTINDSILTITSSEALPGNVADDGHLCFVTDSSLSYSGDISGDGTVSVGGGGTVTLSGCNTYAGVTYIQGTLVLDGGEYTLPTTTPLSLWGGVVQLNGNSQEVAGLTGGGQIINGSTTPATLTVNYTCTEDVMTFDGILGGTTEEENNFGLTKIGQGTLALAGANTYTGDTVIAEGTLGLAGADDRLLTTTTVILGGEISNTSGILDLGGCNQTVARLRMVGTGTENRVINGGGGTPVLTVNVACETDDFEFDGILGGSGSENGFGLTKEGAGAFFLSGVNTYSGATKIAEGVLRVVLPPDEPDERSLPDSSNLFLAGGVLENNGLASLTRQIGDGAGQIRWLGDGGFSAHDGRFTVTVTGAGGQPLCWGTGSFMPSSLMFGSELTANDEVDFAVSIDLDGNLGIINVVDSYGSLNDSVAMIGGIFGEGSLKKVGAGKLILTAQNSYSGDTTVESGVLAIAGGDNRLPEGTTLALGAESNTAVFALNGFSQKVAGLTGTVTSAVVNGLVGNCTPTLTINYTCTGSVLEFLGVLGDGGEGGDNFGLTKTGEGVQVLSAQGTYTGDTTIEGGILRFTEASYLPDDSHLCLDGGTFESKGVFSRDYGSDAGQVCWHNAGRFSAYGEEVDDKLTVAVDGLGEGAQDFCFGSPYANREVEFTSGMALDGGQLFVQVEDNPNVPTDFATLSGAISSGGHQSDIVKAGDGRLRISGDNGGWNGDTYILGGILELGHDNAIPIDRTVTLAGGSLALDGCRQDVALLVAEGSSVNNRVINGGNERGTLWMNPGGYDQFDGVLGGSTAIENNFRLVMDGNGTFATEKRNTLTGPVVVIRGKVEVLGGGSLPRGTPIHKNGVGAEAEDGSGADIIPCEINDETGEAKWLPETGPDGPGDANLGGTADGADQPPSPTTEGGVDNGNFCDADEDDACYGVSRVWSNAGQYDSGDRVGSGWAIAQWPQVLDAGGGRVVVSGGSNDRRWFDYDSILEIYFPLLSNLDSLTRSSGEFILTDTLGNVTRFFDFAAGEKGGQFESYTDAGGNRTEVTEYDGGNITQVVCYRKEATGDVAFDVFDYEYITESEDPNVGCLSAVEHSRPGVGILRQLIYEYYGEDEDFGSVGDLKTVVTKDGSDQTLETKYYRYYKEEEANGYAGALKYSFEGPAFARLAHDFADPFEATDTQVAPYADCYQEYDSMHRVTKRVLAGTGNDGTQGGQATYTYEYELNPTTPALTVNAWQSKTIETLQDGNTKTLYYNANGQVMLDVFENVPTTTKWCTFYEFDAQGRQVLVAYPSAVTGYSEAYAALVHSPSAGNYEFLDDDAGLIVVTEYYGGTTAGESPQGDPIVGGVDGYFHRTSIKQGELGTRALQTHVDYIGHAAGGVMVYPVYSSTVYRDEVLPSQDASASGAEKTTYAYSWVDNSVQKQSMTVTLPSVSGAQHGSGTSHTTTTAYDLFDRPTWTKDADGFISHMEYDPDTGAVIKTITDVDTDETGDEPNGWSSPNGHPLHLVTQYEVDSEGRTTKVTDPNNVTYTVYDDIDCETRVYAGWNTSTNMPTGPTVVYRDDRAHGYFETLTITASPHLTDGLPDGQETFTISDIQTLSRSYKNAGGQKICDDQYYSFSGISSYSEEPDLGSSASNYLRTAYGYDSRGNLARMQDPAGTIRRTVYDVQGRALSQWIGTDDTPPSGTWSPTNTAETNLVRTAAYVYDNGGVGDGNLTQSTAYASDTDSFVTNYKYDWRDRRTGSRGPDNVATFTGYDNLGEAILVETYADADSDFVIDTGELRAQTVYDYDNLGRVYSTQVYEVISGIATSNYLASNVWYNARGLVMKTSGPANVFTKTQYDGACRATASYVSYDTDEADYDEAGDVEGDTVVNASFTVYSGTRVSQTETGTSSENAVVTQKFWYDDEWDGTGVDTHRLTGVSTLKPSDALDYVVTKYEYDSAGRQNVIIQPDPDGTGPLYPTRVETAYDNLGRPTATRMYAVDGTEEEPLLAQTSNTYNSAGQLSASRVYEVSGGEAEDFLETTYDYDGLGLLCKVAQPNGAFTKTLYNAYGRLLGTYLGTAEGWDTDPTTLEDDTIVSQALPFYDAAGRVWLTRSFERDGTGTGELTASDARVTYAVSWFDDLGRTKWAADYGTNGGDDDITSQTYDFDGNGAGTNYSTAVMATRTTGSGGNVDSYILTQYQYDGYGRKNVVIDNRGKTTKTFFDALGRKTHVVENFTDFAIGSGGSESGIGGGANNDQDRVTKFVYNDAGLLTQQIALAASSGNNQVTTYIYAIDLDGNHGACPVPDNGRLRAVVYPDSSDTAAQAVAHLNADESGDFFETAYNAAGLTSASRDQRGVVHTYTYDDLGRLARDAATTIPSGVDDFVKCITYAFDDLGRTKKITSWENADGTGAIRNELAFTFDGWGNVTKSQQSHSGAVDTNTPEVDYAYADGASNNVAKYIRLSYVTYPDGRVVYYNYPDSGIGDALSRLGNIASTDNDPQSADKYAAYTYIGAAAVVQVDHPAVTGGLTLSYGSNRTYAGWDRFGRVVEQTWKVNGSSVDSYQYGYDRNSNRLYRKNLLSAGSALSELYAPNDSSENQGYDGLDRMKAWSRGALDGSNDSIATPSYYQSFTLDTLGNWSTLNDNGASQTRTTDAANEITAVSGSGSANWVDPTYDAAGNMTLAPRPGDEASADEALLSVYDAWNRLTTVYKDSNSNGDLDVETDALIATYVYDGLGRRIQKNVEAVAAENGTVEDFTTYTETDPNSRIGVTDSMLDVNGLTSNEDAYVYRDLAPDLTSASAGTASATSTWSGYPASNAFDGSTTTYWCSASGVTDASLQYDLGDGNEKAVTSYKIYPYPANLNSAPKNWTLEGSDDGVNWASPALDTRSNVTWSTSEWKTFDGFSNSTAYRYYRIHVTAVNGATFICLAELDIGLRPNVNASTTYGSGWEASKAADGGTGTYWCSVSGDTTNSWFKYDLGDGNAQALTSYRIYPYTPNYQLSPKNWTFEGSNDGVNWASPALDTRTNVTDWSAAWKDFSFSNSTAYRYYRLHVTAVNGGSYTCFAELDLGLAATASASSVYGSGWEASRAFDDSATTYWCSATAPSTSIPITLKYDFGAGNAKTVGGYRIAPYTANYALDPKDWTLEGSDTGGSSDWTVLDDVDGATWSSADSKVFALDAEATYRMYRLSVTAVGQGGGYVSLAELDLTPAPVGLSFRYDFEVTLQSAGSGRAAVWAASNEVEDLNHWGTTHQAVSVTLRDDTNALVLTNHEGSGSGYSDTHTGVVQGTKYYLSVSRPTADSIELAIYSNAARTTLLDTLSVTVNSGRTWRYLFGADSYNSGSGSDTISFDVEAGGADGRRRLGPEPVGPAVRRCPGPQVARRGRESRKRP
ncbi:MAG: discoidin domain-containing protein [Planctomycetota bacterium]|nr:discoidin domain-containing protein [Planctomycetota bacterium]